MLKTFTLIFFIFSIGCYFPIQNASAENRPKEFTQEISRAFDAFETVEIFSINPIQNGKDLESFHGYSVLKKRIIKDRKIVIRMKKILLTMVDENPYALSGCFNPRHGIRILNRQREYIDLVICFECHKMEVINKKSKYQVLFDFPLEKVINEEIDPNRNEFDPKMLDAQ